MENLAILVPLKSFSVGKSRLRDGGIAGVDELVRELATRVLAAALPRPRYVTCEYPDVVAFALDMGALVIESPASGLNEAVRYSYERLSAVYEHLIIVHGDLRDPQGIGDFTPAPGITVFTDSHRTGTNVLSLPTGLDFIFRFGAHSAQAHRREAERIGVECHVVFDSPWRFDVDEPGDVLA